MNREIAKRRATELVGKMTLEEKASQLLYNSPAIDRLGIKEYCWWNEALHGVARTDIATVFPQAIGLAATFDNGLIEDVADIISIEARAKFNESQKLGDYDIFKGITYWSPNINIFRDPRWGRGQETYGECPFLASYIGKSFVKGLQGEGEFLKTAACAKHLAAHSGPEKLRHTFDAEVSVKDLNETYLPAFEKLVKESDVEGVMGAYNRLNGEPCCAHSYIMGEKLFKEWNFKGYYVSDCGAICDFHKTHKITKTGAESAALAIKAGCNINCGEAYQNILLAVEQELITEEDIEYNLIKAYTTRFLLGEFEENRPYSDVPFDVVDCDEHKEMNRETARRSLVLLKNDGILPLRKDKIKSIAVIGPNANSVNALMGNYAGLASQYVTVVDGIRNAVPNARINYSLGADMMEYKYRHFDGHHNNYSNAISAATHSDVSVICVGIDATVEGESNLVENEYIDHGDKTGVSLPKSQLDLIDKVCAVTDKVIVVMLSGSAIDFGETAMNEAGALIQGWYPGAQGGNAIADLIFGEYSPSGRLPVTLYKADAELPDFCDYSMKNRTYRFYKDEPLFSFGYGLSYADFEYSNANLISLDNEKIIISVNVTNTSDINAREITQVYAKFGDSMIETPVFQLCGVSSNDISANETITVTFNIDTYWLKAVNEQGERVTPDGRIELFIGSHQPDKRSNTLTNSECLKIIVK